MTTTGNETTLPGRSVLRVNDGLLQQHRNRKLYSIRDPCTMPAASYAAQENPVSQTAGVSCTPVQCSVPVRLLVYHVHQFSAVQDKH